MTRRIAVTLIAVLAPLALTAAWARADAGDKPAEGKAPPPAEVQMKFAAWLAEQKADQPTRKKAIEVWAKLSAKPSELDVLLRLSDGFAAANADAAKLAAVCAAAKAQVMLPEQAWLTDAKTPAFLAANMRLLYGRWLVQAEMYDEALQQLSGLKPSEVVAPATLLFYQAVAEHSLLERDEGLKTLARLMQAGDDSPRRYIAVAKLLEEDLKSLKDDSLDHIARRMGDVRRRLDLGRAGKKVRDQEDGIIESLDKIIKKLEDQQAAAAAAGGIADNIRSSSPAPDSMPIGGKGPGDVQKRNIGSQADWGRMPPSEREKALQQMGKDLPSHYRDVIEEYFRRLAGSEK